jgi:hypothetical protein
MMKWYLITLKGIMGTECGDRKELCIINRRFRAEKDSLVYEPGPKHMKRLYRQFDWKADSKGLDSPRMKNDAGMRPDGGVQ